MDQSYAQGNAAGLNRLRTYLEQLSDEELAREIDTEWTVGVVCMHLAFWDRYLAARWTAATREGLRVPAAVPDYVPALINEAALDGWRAVPPHLAAQLAVAAAENAEHIVAGLSPERANEAIEGGRPTLVDRTRHWFEHLDQIAAALGH